MGKEGKGMGGKRGKKKGSKRVVGRLRERLVVALDNAALDVVVGDPVLVGHRSDLGEHHWRLFESASKREGCNGRRARAGLRSPARAGT